MKNKFLLSNLIVIAIAFVLAATSCTPKDDGTTTKPVVVEDAYYVVGSSTPFSEKIKAGTLNQGYYEGESFKATARDGMYQKYIFITKAGDGFTIQKVAGGVETTLGVDGALTADADNPWAYTGTIKENGAALTVPEDGVYFVILDEGTNKFYVFQTNSWSIIGDATGGWSTDNDMTNVTLAADGSSWKIEGLEMRKGSYKFRANHNWTYKLDSVSAFTNLGDDGNSAIMPGGSNFALNDEGIYTVELKFDGTRFTADKVFTDSIAPSQLPEHVWLVGSVNDWDNHGIYMEAQGNDVHVAYNNLADDSEVKLLVARDSWDVTWGAGDAAGKIAKGGGNIVIKDLPDYKGAGFYQLKFDFKNETVTLTQITTFGMIGDAINNWDADNVSMTYDATTNTWKAQATITNADGGFKFRANKGWDINYGGSLDSLKAGGDNLSAALGTYDVELNLSGADAFVATMTAVK